MSILDDLRQQLRKPITLPGTDTQLFITTMPLATALEVESLTDGSDEDNARNIDAIILGARSCIVDENGARVFDSDEGEEFLRSLGVAQFQYLSDKIADSMSKPVEPEGN